MFRRHALPLLLAVGLACGPGYSDFARAGADHGNYAPVLPERPMVFPRDYGAHPAHRTEWWYVTGWLRDETGAERGFQVTFFRVATRIGADNPSRFAPRQLILAHAAIADPTRGRFLHAERSARAVAPLAGADETHTASWIRDWSLAWQGDRYRTRIAAADFAFDLELVPPGPPVLNGEGGYSRKAPQAGHASYYYSRPHLKVGGTLELDGKGRQVSGHAWLDHEWSSTLMPPSARGWDWIGINLADGGSLMAFRMRDADGKALWAGATLVDGQGRAHTLGADEVRFEPLRSWRSPRTGADYPVSWRVALTLATGERQFRIEPLLDDQELDSRRSTGAVYWEGAVRLHETTTDGATHEAGQGYLEMTGYAERLEM